MESTLCCGYAYEAEDGCTYKTTAVKEAVDGKKKVLSCTIIIKALVRTDEEEDDGGWIIEIDCGVLGKYEGFLVNTAWKTPDSFLSCLRKGCKGLPAIFCKLSQSDLQDYGDGLHSQFIQDAKENGRAIFRKRVVRLGRQSDDNTIIFGPNDAFCMGQNGVYGRVELSSTDCVWIPESMPNLSITKDVPAEFDALRFISTMLPKDTLSALCVALGGTHAGFHYELTLTNFQRMPGVCLHGETNCGKSLVGDVCLEFYAYRAAQLFSLKSVTVAALREMITSQTVPVVIHDPANAEIIKVAVDDTYERKGLATCKDRRTPRTSAIITLNGDALAEFRNFDNMRGMSRLVIIPFRTQIAEREAELRIGDKNFMKYLCQHAEKLFQLQDIDIAVIAKFHKSIFPDVLEKLEKYGMDQSKHRIAFNISLIYGYARQVLQTIDLAGCVDPDDVRSFVLKEMCKEAATWQTKPHTKTKHTPPQTPSSPNKKILETPSNEGIHNIIIERAIQQIGCSDAKHFSRMFSGKTKTGGTESYVAFKHDAAEAELRNKGLDVTFLRPFQDAVRLIPGAEISRDIRFGTRILKASIIPAGKISKSILEMLATKDTNAATVEAAAESHAQPKPVVADTLEVHEVQKNADTIGITPHENEINAQGTGTCNGQSEQDSVTSSALPETVTHTADHAAVQSLAAGSFTVAATGKLPCGDEITGSSTLANAEAAQAAAESSSCEGCITDSPRSQESSTKCATDQRLSSSGTTSELQITPVRLTERFPSPKLVRPPEPAAHASAGGRKRGKDTAANGAKPVAEDEARVTRAKKARISLLSTDEENIPCGTCGQKIDINNAGIGCIVCKKWHHAKCQGIKKKLTAAKERDFKCLSCKSPGVVSNAGSSHDLYAAHSTA